MRRTSSWCRIYQHNERGWQDRRQVLCGEAFLGSGKRCDRPCKSWESIAITVCFAATNLLDIPWVRLGVLSRSLPTVKRWRGQKKLTQRFHEDHAIEAWDRQWVSTRRCCTRRAGYFLHRRIHGPSPHWGHAMTWIPMHCKQNPCSSKRSKQRHWV